MWHMGLMVAAHLVVWFRFEQPCNLKIPHGWRANSLYNLQYTKSNLELHTRKHTLLSVPVIIASRSDKQSLTTKKRAFLLLCSNLSLFSSFLPSFLFLALLFFTISIPPSYLSLFFLHAVSPPTHNSSLMFTFPAPYLEGSRSSECPRVCVLHTERMYVCRV